MSGECILTGNWTADLFPGWTERLSPLTSPNSGPPEDVSTRTKMINWLVIKPWLRPEYLSQYCHCDCKYSSVRIRPEDLNQYWYCDCKYSPICDSKYSPVRIRPEDLSQYCYCDCKYSPVCDSKYSPVRIKLPFSVVIMISLCNVQIQIPIQTKKTFQTSLFEHVQHQPIIISKGGKSKEHQL